MITYKSDTWTVMPDLIRHPEDSEHWIPAFAVMTLCAIVGVVVHIIGM
jgi:hypothetical protein